MSTLKGVVSRFKGKNILVIGDVILDRHIQGTVSRISPEAPVPIVLQQGDHSYAPGGAANVAQNLRSLQAKVTLVGRIGKDAEGKELLGVLKRKKISTAGIFADPQVPTTVKTRIMAQHQQVLRLDRERVTGEPDEGFLKKVFQYLQKNFDRYDAVIISDYGKGMVCRELIEATCALAHKKKKVLTVDPKVEHFSYYRGVTAITPNRSETENAIRNIKITHNARRTLSLTSDRLKTLNDVEKAGRQLVKFLDLESLLITLSEQGMYLFEKGKKPRHIPTRAQEVFDVTGAGDTVIAVFTLALAAGADKFQAADLANHAAGIVVAQMGPVTVEPKELLQAVKS